MKADKCPGPDGVSVLFFQRFWATIKENNFSVVQAFFHSGFLLKDLNHTYITLISKCDHPQTFRDFRPISLNNVVQKVISKSMVNKLQPILQDLIAPNQNGFIKGRSMNDNNFLASELTTYIHKTKKVKKHWCALKLDISKAYDRLSWNFIEAVLIKMQFSSHWIQLIKQCFSTVSYTILLNGHIALSFIPQRGVRQGDPLSSYLFLLCSNILSCMLHKLEGENKIKRI